MLGIISAFLLAPHRSAFGQLLGKGANPERLDQDQVNVLLEVSDSLHKVYSFAQRALVFVSVTRISNQHEMGVIDPYLGPYRSTTPPTAAVRSGVGSGYITNLSKGFVVTNHHVIEGAKEIFVKLADGSVYPGEVIGTDASSDIAVIKIHESLKQKKGLGELSFADSDEVKVGQLALAIGAPFGLETSFSLGVIAAKGRGSLKITEFGNFLQTDAAINPGNSGGPLLNAMGEVIGMNTAIYSRSGAYNGIGFAAPANLVKDISTQLVKYGTVKRGFLGVYLQALEPDFSLLLGVPDGTTGLVVRDTVRGGPAEKAGLISGDFIISMDGKNFDLEADAMQYVATRSPGDTLRISLLREHKELDLSVTLKEFPNQKRKEEAKSISTKLGFLLETLPTQSKGPRVSFRIQKLAFDSPAYRNGMREGDILYALNRKPLESKKQLEKSLLQGGNFLLSIRRDQELFFIPWRSE